MMTNIIRRLSVLLLALAVLMPATGLAENTPFEDFVECVEANTVEESVSEAEDISLSDLPREDGEEPDEGEDPPGTGDDGSEDGETGEEAPSPVGPALVQSSLTLGVKEKATLTLEGDATPQSVGAVFSSNKPKVVSVNKTTGAIVAKKKGTAVITMQTGDGATSACEVTVLGAPWRVRLSKQKLTLGVGETAKLKATLPDRTASSIRFSSSNEKVVAVDAHGNIVALNKGTAKVTARTFNNRRATCNVTVKAAPESVEFSASAISLWLGDIYTASIRLSKNSAGAYTLTSSDESVVAVKGNKLKAVGPGSATVTVSTYNDMTAAMTVEARRKPVYRALLIGETTFPGTRFGDLPGKKDVAMMKGILKNTKGAAKTGWSVTTAMDRTAAEIYGDIQTAFSGAQESDVSLFYISTHGDERQSFDGDWPEFAGYLMTYPNYRHENWYDRYTLTLVCLAEWLKEVPGQVIVIIDSCGSGAAIYGANSNSAPRGDAFERFDAAVVNAFKARDEGVVVSNSAKGAFVVQNKFYVLTAAGYQEACYTKKGAYSYFTKWLTDGIAKKGKMPADADKNKFTTLNELYKYIKKKGDNTSIQAKGFKYRQHVQVYPSGSGFELFYRK